MPVETAHPGYVTLSAPPEMGEHGLRHAANHEFFAALLEVVDLLRAECLLRECHPIHEKLADLSNLIRAEHCQDFVAEIYPAGV